MRSPCKIGISLLDDDLKNLINASAKIYPMSYADISANLNPGGYEWCRCVDLGDHHNEIYKWNDVSAWELIGADDKSVDFETEVKNKPDVYPPDRTQIDIDLGNKVDKVTGKGLSSNDYTNDEKVKLAGLSENASMDYTEMYNALQDHEIDNSRHLTTEDLTAIAAVADKAEKTYVDQGLQSKADSSTVTGHINNSTIHVLQTDKDAWNGSLITLGTVQPASGWWFKVTG